MKQKVQNILVLLMAVTVFFVGAGVTIIDLCCNNCIENLISIKKTTKHTCHDFSAFADKTEHSCCEQKTDSDNESHSCTNKHEGKCCDAERLSVDIDSRIFKPDLTNSALVWSTLHCQCCCFCHTIDIEEDALYSCIDDIPIPPREYLSLLRVLII